jgi:hypothetical protein
MERGSDGFTRIKTNKRRDHREYGLYASPPRSLVSVLSVVNRLDPRSSAFFLYSSGSPHQASKKARMFSSG